MGKICAVCISEKKGTPKHNVGEAELLVDCGLKGDAHAGNGHRQVSFLSFEAIKDFGAEVSDGAFGENLIIEGLDFNTAPIGTVINCGKAILEVTQIGKECHDHCEIFKRMGDCIMPRVGLFAKVLQGGTVKIGDDFYVK
jgi:MOSC domain-containing protein YiiM